MFLCLLQVHKLGGSAWHDVAVVPIDIADRSEVSSAVSRNSLLVHSVEYECAVWRLHVDRPDHYHYQLPTQSSSHEE